MSEFFEGFFGIWYKAIMIPYSWYVIIPYAFRDGPVFLAQNSLEFLICSQQPTRLEKDL